MAHDGSPNLVALSVLAWLMTRPTARVVIGPADVLPKLSEYSARKLELDQSWEAKTPWGRVLDLASEVAGG